MKVMYIDHYDSFANTIVAYFVNNGAEVSIYKSDCSLDVIEKENPDLIVLGPGPKGPKEAGNYLDIIDKFHKTKPIFGICLGFQALMEYFGEEVKPLKEIIHGSATKVSNDGKTIFKNIINDEKFARYHSLGVLDVPKCFEVSAKIGDIVMAARHKEFKIEGIQFHPESILSMHDDSGNKLIKNVMGCLK